MTTLKALSVLPVIMVLFATPAAGQGPPLRPSDVAEFMGTWAVTMTDPPELKGLVWTVRVWDENGVVAASFQAGRSPSHRVTAVVRDTDMLVLTISHEAQPGLLENGAPIWAVIALTRDGDTMRAALLLERSATVKRGIGRKEGQ